MIRRRHLPLAATAAVLVLLAGTAGLLYDGFLSARVGTNLLTDNAVLGLAATGLTLVILAGGIDLSVGAVAGFTSVLVAVLVERHGLHPALAAAFGLLAGTGLGAGMGVLIHAFRQPPFLITLAGLFLMRGAAGWLSLESIALTHPLSQSLSAFEVPLGAGAGLAATAILFLAAFAAAAVLAHGTRFGANLYALGGNENSALLMGVPVARTRIIVYALSGFGAALAGLALVIYTGSGNPMFGIGLELDAIAVVVIGGTLLSGGRGHLAGTFLGLLVYGVIQTALTFDGRLSAHWSRIVVGALLLAFILLQRALLHLGPRRT